MECYTHQGTNAVGVCALCQKGVCRDCVGAERGRIVCRSCVSKSAVLGFEYKSTVTLGSWPLVHVCAGVDPMTMRPKVARGVIAIGNIAVGGLAIGGLSLGLLTLGGASIGVLFAMGGAALGLGLAVGGLAVGSVAIGGLAVGTTIAVGGVAFGPAIVDGIRCDQEAREFLARWAAEALLPPHCR